MQRRVRRRDAHATCYDSRLVMPASSVRTDVTKSTGAAVRLLNAENLSALEEKRLERRPRVVVVDVGSQSQHVLDHAVRLVDPFDDPLRSDGEQLIEDRLQWNAARDPE